MTVSDSAGFLFVDNVNICIVVVVVVAVVVVVGLHSVAQRVAPPRTKIFPVSSPSKGVSSSHSGTPYFLISSGSATTTTRGPGPYSI